MNSENARRLPPAKPAVTRLAQALELSPRDAATRRTCLARAQWHGAESGPIHSTPRGRPFTRHRLHRAAVVARPCSIHPSKLGGGDEIKKRQGPLFKPRRPGAQTEKSSRFTTLRLTDLTPGWWICSRLSGEQPGSQNHAKTCLARRGPDTPVPPPRCTH